MKNIHKYTLISAMVTLMAACSGSDLEITEPDGNARTVILFSTPADSKEFSWTSGLSSRAGSDVKSEIPDNFGVFAFGDGKNTTYIFRNQKVLNIDSKEYTENPFRWTYTEESAKVWPYTTDSDGSVQRPWEKMHYRFFAYSPWYKTNDVNVTAENYTGFNSFTWDNIPGFSDKDYVVANAIIDLDNTDDSFTTTDPVVKFEMRHILSRIRFFFCIDPRYRVLRRFEINSLTMLTAGKVKSATFNFRNDAWDQTVHWSNEQTGTPDPVTLYSADGLAYDIPKAFTDEPYTSVYVYPQDNLEEVKMTIDYTVYDSADMPVRRSQVTNIITLPGWNLLSGYYYDIRIKIFPDYLYVLSDHDQDFDGYVIIKDTATPTP